jgi:hypothetical protein
MFLLSSDLNLLQLHLLVVAAFFLTYLVYHVGRRLDGLANIVLYFQ